MDPAASAVEKKSAGGPLSTRRRAGSLAPAWSAASSTAPWAGSSREMETPYSGSDASISPRTSDPRLRRRPPAITTVRSAAPSPTLRPAARM